MQRQSLGSPGSSSSSSFSSSSSSRPPYADPFPESYDVDSSKPRRRPGQRTWSSSTPDAAAASTIHLIPALMLFCFLLLYLLSHDPSPSDMAAAFGRPGDAAATLVHGGAASAATGTAASRRASAKLSGHRALKQTGRLLDLSRAAGGRRSSRKLRGGGGGGGHRRLT